VSGVVCLRPVSCVSGVVCLRPVSCVSGVVCLRPVSCVSGVVSVFGLFSLPFRFYLTFILTRDIRIRIKMMFLLVCRPNY
jgi:hypothetical protein